MSYCPPPLPQGHPRSCPFIVPLLTPHFPFFSRSSPSPAPSAYPTCALQAVPELQPSPCSQALQGKTSSATRRLSGCRQQAQSELSPLLHSQEGVKCPPCTSHTARLTHNVTGPTGLQVSCLFLLRCFFHCSQSTRRVSAMRAHFFGGGCDDHSFTEGETGGQQHDFPCLWAVLPRDKRLSRSQGTDG